MREMASSNIYEMNEWMIRLKINFVLREMSTSKICYQWAFCNVSVMILCKNGNWTSEEVRSEWKANQLNAHHFVAFVDDCLQNIEIIDDEINFSC